MQRFSGRVAVVTGAARGIGAATARRLAAEGATVAVVGLREDTAKLVAADITADGGSACAYGADVSDRDEVAAVFDRIVAEHGKLDVLVNNAGITRDNLLFKMSYDDWDAVLRTNLTSTFLCCHAAQKHMVPARYGKIVNLSSRSSFGARGQANYAATKAGIQGLTATLAIELGPFNVTVNAVAPGYVATGMTEATARRVGVTPEEHQQQAADRTPLRRVGQPVEIAAVIAFLASDDASYVSGQTLYVNGGAR
ncbi:3-oxoacyl-ACP reductase FabG [Cryptosporangium japonicum]|uniref:3-oxoacyl-ACP reductase FabG n=1 Tax=Cryptosporangium japonicum TaxID=80872 RepID=UPI0031DE9107